MTETTDLKPRLRSLDVFRGITVAAMILVNNPGDWGHIYAPLEHAEWNGCTPTDLIFPFFLFIVGVSIVFALGSKKENPETHNKLILVALKRSAILFGLGLFLSLFPLFDFSVVRILGVLQRIAIVYFICVVIFIKTNPKTQWKLMIGILLAYWAIMTLIPVPGVGYANLGKETNLGAWLDRLVLTVNHTWKLSKTWDPEGILSTLPAIGTGLFGILIGNLLKSNGVDVGRYMGTGLIEYTMYSSFRGLVSGWTKNISKMFSILTSWPLPPKPPKPPKPCPPPISAPA